MSIGDLSSLIPFEAVVFFVVFALIVGVLEAFLGKSKRRRHRSRRWQRPGGGSVLLFRRPAASPPTESVEFDAAQQLRLVMASAFEKRSLLSRQEAWVFAAAEQAINEAGLSWRVMAQVSIGEFVSTPNQQAYRAVNSKRVDMLIVSHDSQPIAAIEYQGEGHYQGTAPARDAIKREALRKAGIRFIEITHEHGPDDVSIEIARLAKLEQARVQGSAQ